MPEIRSAQGATDVAVTFLKPYYSFIRPLRASKRNGMWLVEIDVGPLATRVARFEINAETGDIVTYEAPGD